MDEIVEKKRTKETHAEDMIVIFSANLKLISSSDGHGPATEPGVGPGGPGRGPEHPFTHIHWQAHLGV